MKIRQVHYAIALFSMTLLSSCGSIINRATTEVRNEDEATAKEAAKEAVKEEFKIKK